MFKRSIRSGDRVEKSVKLKKTVRDAAKLSKLQKSVEESPSVDGYVVSCYVNSCHVMSMYRHQSRLVWCFVGLN